MRILDRLRAFMDYLLTIPAELSAAELLAEDEPLVPVELLLPRLAQVPEPTIEPVWPEPTWPRPQRHRPGTAQRRRRRDQRRGCRP